MSRAWQRAAPVEPLCGLGFPPHRGETPGREEGPQGLALTRSPGCSSSGPRFPSLWDGAMSPLGASRKARVAPPGSVCPTFQRWFGTGGRSVASGRSCLLDPQVWSGLGLRVLGAPSLSLCWVPRPGTSGASVLTEHSTAPSTLENSCPSAPQASTGPLPASSAHPSLPWHPVCLNRLPPQGRAQSHGTALRDFWVVSRMAGQVGDGSPGSPRGKGAAVGASMCQLRGAQPPPGCLCSCQPPRRPSFPLPLSPGSPAPGPCFGVPEAAAAPRPPNLIPQNPRTPRLLSFPLMFPDGGKKHFLTAPWAPGWAWMRLPDLA